MDVLVRDYKRYAAHAYHLPKGDGSGGTRCGSTAKFGFTTTAETDLPERFHLCERCDPDEEIPNDNQGQRFSAGVANLNPEDLGLSPIGERGDV